MGFVIAPKTAASLKNWLNSLDNRRLFLILSGLILLVVVKFLTFVYSPLANGFEVCYRSVYAPFLVTECEKSYDQLYVSNGTILEKISLIEKEINFAPSIFGIECKSGLEINQVHQSCQ